LLRHWKRICRHEFIALLNHQATSMKKLTMVALIAIGESLAAGAEPALSSLPRSQPEAQGVSSSALLAFVDLAERKIDSLHSFMLVRHGHVVAEGWWAPYRAESPHALYSLTKSFTSTAVGLAVTDGKLSIDDEVLKFFPDDAPKEPSKNLKTMRVSDLLRMSTGHQAEPRLAPGDVWTKKFLGQDVPHKPGTHFLYNTAATYMLSAIVQKATGMTVLDYLRPRLFEPLGITNPTWGTSPQGVSVGGYGLNIRTEDIARFGQLYLQKGKWRGKQLVPHAWVDAATARQTSNGSNPLNDWDQGYGYQFWRCRHGAFRGDGAFGQFCIVLPEQDAVIAITSGVKDMQSVLNLVWEQLLPAIQTGPLAADQTAQMTLAEKLSKLSLRPQEGKGAPASPSKVSRGRYVFSANDRKLEEIELLCDDKSGSVTLGVKSGGVQQKISCGRGNWDMGRLAYGAFPEQPVGASGAWTADDTFTAKICFYETPFCITMALKFSEGQLLCNTSSNVAFGPTEQPQLVGKLEPLRVD
jgi:CubicO group peptidase (beta-lactamase class C family)